MTTMEEAPASVDLLKDVRIIDCDAHFTEPAELWTSRAPAELVNRMPVLRTVDGITAWYVEGELWASIGGNTIQTDADGHARKVLGSHVVQPYELIDKSAFAVKERLELLDEIGVYAQILYPNGIGFASNHIFAIEDLELRTAILQIYNDFLIDVQNESNGRLYPQGLLPVWDMDLTVKEITRLAAQGMKGFTMSDKPEMIGLPELWEDYWTPTPALSGIRTERPKSMEGAGRDRGSSSSAVQVMVLTPSVTWPSSVSIGVSSLPVVTFALQPGTGS